ncbi:amidohydrolase [Acetivibrio cellulolyticus]|uniref:amidohydrolase n=1 Tax=Acetivibrio cellulolyticus TaxID=35830 RepID=UPI0001E2FB2E|nr:amidohydrolase [Acetivibrio cellulolyticus]
MNILIKHIDVLTCDEENKVIKDTNIGIKENYIDFIGGNEEKLREFKADKVIDGRNKLAMPGLINTHTHCGMTILRNYANDLPLEDWLFNNIIPTEAKLTEEDIYWGTMLGMAEMIKSGTTTFTDMYYHMDTVAKAVEETGMRANLSRNAFKFIGSESEMVRNQVPVCVEYFKNWHNKANGRMKVYVEIHSVYLCDEDGLTESAQLAKELGTGIHIHLLETLHEREEGIKRYGADPIEVCSRAGVFDVPVIAAHCVHLSDDNYDVLKSKGVSVAHNPTSNLKLGSGIANVPLMMKKGINVALGTDGAASNNNLNMFEEMHIAALIHKGVQMQPTLVTAEEVLKMATVNGAKATGFGGEIGQIREGLKADILLIDMDKAHIAPVNDYIPALVYCVQGSDVDTVIIDGNILMENRVLKTIDEEKAKNKVKEISKRVLNK